MLASSQLHDWDQPISGAFSLLIGNMGEVSIKGPPSQGCGEDQWGDAYGI